MDEQILPAREVRKVHTESSGSFAAPEFGPLGVVDAGAVMFRRRHCPAPDVARRGRAEPGLRVQRIDTRVELVQAYTGMDDRLIRTGRRPTARAAWRLSRFGRGNVPPAIMPALADAVNAGVIVTISSRCVAGRVEPALRLRRRRRCSSRKIGAILAGDLSGAKARLLQMVALGCERDVERARRLITSHSENASQPRAHVRT